MNPEIATDRLLYEVEAKERDVLLEQEATGAFTPIDWVRLEELPPEVLKQYRRHADKFNLLEDRDWNRFVNTLEFLDRFERTYRATVIEGAYLTRRRFRWIEPSTSVSVGIIFPERGGVAVERQAGVG